MRWSVDIKVVEAVCVKLWGLGGKVQGSITDKWKRNKRKDNSHGKNTIDYKFAISS